MVLMSFVCGRTTAGLCGEWLLLYSADGFEPSHHLARRTFDDFAFVARGIINVTPTLAVAFELRTANSIAMLDTSNDRAEVCERLGLQCDAP
jgi:hypothetical protein